MTSQSTNPPTTASTEISTTQLVYSLEKVFDALLDRIETREREQSSINEKNCNRLDSGLDLDQVMLDRIDKNIAGVAQIRNEMEILKANLGCE